MDEPKWIMQAEQDVKDYIFVATDARRDRAEPSFLAIMANLRELRELLGKTAKDMPEGRVSPAPWEAIYDLLNRQEPPEVE